MGDAEKPELPDNTSDDSGTYKSKIDAAHKISDRVSWAFACYAKDTPDMQVLVGPGSIHYGLTVVEKTEQTSSTITAPSGNPRIDRVVVDHHTGVMAIVTGSESASPVPPALSAGQVPVAQILLDNSPATTQITNSLITDERALSRLGLEIQSDEIKAGAVDKTAIGAAAVGRSELDNSTGSASGNLAALDDLDIVTNTWAFIYFFGGDQSDLRLRPKSSGTNGINIENTDAKASAAYDIRWRIFDT
jgi:hypothetical protein